MPRRAEAENVLRFTKAVVSSLKPREGRSETTFWDEEVRGFGIRVRASGHRTWIIRPPRSGGESRLHTLGSAELIDLAVARRTARDQLAHAERGGDPTRDRQEARARAAVTFGAVIKTYLADRERHLRPTTVGNLRNHFHAHWAPLHDRPLTSITRAEVAIRHGGIASEHPHAADRAQSVLSTFFGWAIRQGLADLNPASNLNRATQPEKRERVLGSRELAAIWSQCRDDDFGRIIRILILTGLRRDEVAGMRWSEVDRLAALWTIPKERMKGKRLHEVPLSRQVRDILADVPDRGRDFVFGSGEGPFSGFSKAKSALDRRVGSKVAPWRIHDIRHTVDTGMNDIGVLPHIASEVLSHLGEHKRGIAGRYNHSAYRCEKREALTRWANFVQTVAPSAKSRDRHL